jgi:hypothetical protein
MEGVVILHIVVVRLVEDRIRIVIAVGVLVPNPSNLTQLHMRVGILVGVLPLQGWWHIGVVTGLAWTGLLCEVLARQ